MAEQQGQELQEHEYEEVASVFKVFGDTTRIRILFALADREMCVGDIATELNLGQSVVSHQLTTLRQAKLVKTRRDGKSIIYALDDDHVKEILEIGLEHVREA